MRCGTTHVRVWEPPESCFAMLLRTPPIGDLPAFCSPSQTGDTLRLALPLRTRHTQLFACYIAGLPSCFTPET